MPQFETRRLLLRAVHASDIPCFEKYFVDYDVVGHLAAAVPWPYPAKGVQTFLETAVFPQQGKTRWTWGIFLKENLDELIGVVDLWRDGKPENRGFWLGKKFWGQGFMTEAVRPVIDYAFESLGFETLVFSNAVGNEKSRRVKVKTGARFIEVQTANFVNPNYTQKEIWELSKHDWKALPIAREAYEKLADRFSALAVDKAENAYIEQPAMRKILGDVSGKKILDAGCGPGILSQYLLESGAAVTGFDVSPAMVSLAKQRNSNRGEFFVGNMGEPQTEIPGSHYDFVVSSLALDYVKDWSVPLGEFFRVLKPNGRFVFSCVHPLASFLWHKPPTAFGIHYIETPWYGFGGTPVIVPDFYRSLSEVLNPILKSGFEIVAVHETKPIEELAAIDRAEFDKYNKKASFLIVETKKNELDCLRKPQ